MSGKVFKIESHGRDRTKETVISRYLQQERHDILAMAFHHRLDYNVHVVDLTYGAMNVDLIWSKINNVSAWKDTPTYVIVICEDEHRAEAMMGIFKTARTGRAFSLSPALFSLLNKKNVHFHVIGWECEHNISELYAEFNKIFDKENEMALKRSKTFKVIGTLHSSLISLIRMARDIIEQSSPFVHGNEYNSDVQFVVCFTTSITRNYEDHFEFIQNLLEEQKRYNFNILFINLYQFEREKQELIDSIEFEGTRSQYLFNDRVTWNLVSAGSDRSIEEAMRPILNEYVHNMKSLPVKESKLVELPPQTVSLEDYQKDMRHLQKQVDELRGMYLKFYQDCNNLEKTIEQKVQTAIDKIKAELVSCVLNETTELIRNIVIAQLTKNSTITDVVKQFEQILSSKMDMKVVDLLKKVDSSLQKKFPDSETAFSNYIEEVSTSADTTVATESDDSLVTPDTQEISASTGSIDGEADEANLCVEKILAVAEKCGLRDLFVDDVVSSWDSDRLSLDFEKTLNMPIIQFYENHAASFVKKSGKVYGSELVHGVCKTHQFKTVLDVIAKPTFEPHIPIRQNLKFVRMVADILHRSYGVKFAWLE